LARHSFASKMQVMRARKTFPLVLALLVVGWLWLAGHALAQSGGATPRRLTNDGRSTPIAWDSAGVIVARPGSLVGDRIANEWWRINLADGSALLVTADAPSGAPTRPVASAQRVFVVNGDALQPELWLADADGANARLLLKGEGEYFFTPTLSPDGARFAFTRTPSGSETHAFSSVWLGDMTSGAVKPLLAEASSPIWSADGEQLAFEHRGDVWIGSWKLEVGSWRLGRQTRRLEVGDWRLEMGFAKLPTKSEPIMIEVQFEVFDSCSARTVADRV